MGDWLDESVGVIAAKEVPLPPVAVSAAAEPDDTSWLDDDKPVAGIEVPKSGLPYDVLRFSCMRGSGRVWACDGRYVAYRPFNHVLDKEANPAFQERIERFKRAGHFTHVGTFDEVQVFKLDPESPWYAKTDEAYIAGKSLWKDIQHAAKLACARDWTDYHDLLQAMATGMMAGRGQDFARKCWEDAVNQIMINIYQRRGPTPAEIRAGVQNVQKGRGYAGAPKILLASDVTQAGHVQRE